MWTEEEKKLNGRRMSECWRELGGGGTSIDDGWQPWGRVTQDGKALS